MSVRTAKPQDLDTLVLLWRELMDYHAGLDPFFQVVPHANRLARAQFAESLIDPYRRVFVAEEDGLVVGFVTAAQMELHPIYPRRARASINDIAVTSSFRGRGHGRDLVQAVRDWAKNEGLTAIDLHAAWRNPGARRFWVALGFVERLVIMEQNVS